MYSWRWPALPSSTDPLSGGQWSFSSEFRRNRPGCVQHTRGKPFFVACQEERGWHRRADRPDDRSRAIHQRAAETACALAALTEIQRISLKANLRELALQNQRIRDCILRILRKRAVFKCT